MYQNKIIKEAILLWNGNTDEFIKLTGGFQSDVYKYKCGNEIRILRVVKNNQPLDLDILKGEIEYIEHLASRGIFVSRPYLSIHDKYIEEMNVNEQHYYISSFSYVNGNLIDVCNPKEWNQAIFEHWGSTMGKMHSVSKELGFNTIRRPKWNHTSLDNTKTAAFLSSISKESSMAFENLLKKIHTLPKERETFGLIHNDFHQGNFFVQNGQITIFDFADCAYCWFAQDIAASFYHAVWQGKSFNPEEKEFPTQFLNSFLKGYRKENELNKEILLQIPLFLKVREFFLFTLFHQKWDLQQLEDWQAYTLSDLRLKIENEIPYTEVDFESFL